MKWRASSAETQRTSFPDQTRQGHRIGCLKNGKKEEVPLRQCSGKGLMDPGKGLKCYLVYWRILCIERMQSDFLFTKVTLVWSRDHRHAKQEAEGLARRLLRSLRDRILVNSSRVEVRGGKRRQWLATCPLSVPQHQLWSKVFSFLSTSTLQLHYFLLCHLKNTLHNLFRCLLVNNIKYNY